MTHNAHTPPQAAPLQEYVVTHTVHQTVAATSPEVATGIASRALDKSPALWWPDTEHVSTEVAAL